MIRYTSGDILRSEAEALVNTVNCVGVMGRGIALQFKKAFPKNYEAYRIACDRGEVVPGKMFVFERSALTAPRFIINFPTKRHWRGKSKLEDVEAGLVALREAIIDRDIRSIAVPPLGAGLGGLNWPDVRSRITDSLADLDTEVIVFEPGSAPDAKVMARTTTPPAMSPGRATLVTLIDRYLRGLLDPFVTLLELQKLMYFAQVAGEPLKLSYKKHHYGPYTDTLRHVLNTVEGHFVSGYADGGDLPNKQLELVPGALADAEKVIEGSSDTRDRLDRVGKLVDGFESPVGLELLATVHWVMHHEQADTPDEAIARTHSWNLRKRAFTPRQIKLAYERLSEEGWGPTPRTPL